MDVGPRPATTVVMMAALLAGSLMAAGPTSAASSPPESSAAQPTLPGQAAGLSARPAGAPPPSPVVERTLGSSRTPADVRKHAFRRSVRHRHVARGATEPVPPDLARPAVAGVALLLPLPRPPQPPHITVPLPDYPLDSLATLFTTPPPPIVCHHTPREPGLPDPAFYRERTLRCEPDNP